ncbi:cytochrome P450 monooxygenase OleP [Streptomyces sp. BK208]|uniref:cytochrome P450 n=1 Tax=Streptomyces sp. BK208 TaxID=2512150 RepID=UPI00105F045C|nr:cytochrome P450 [Streptomyces sp. BK208]TDT20936.1 cytochrome P450 monooxygenase OleP [Streptomyces sp. BK208]
MSQYTAGQLGPLPDFLLEGTEDVTRIVTPAGDKMWLVRDYALGRAVLTDKRFSRAGALAPEAPKFNDAQPTPDSMMSMDGDRHTRLRRIVSGAFSTGRIAAMGPFVGELADRHLDAIAAHGPGADLVEHLAAPLPLAVLCSVLGIPPEDSARFRDWVEVLFDISASEPREKARRRVELAAYITDLVGHKRRQPQDDLLSSLIEAHDRGDLTMSELLTLGLTLLMAGYETTVGQLGLSVLSLLSDPVTHRELVARPDAIAPAVEELLRVNPATPLAFPRVALQPVRLGSVTVQAGEAVMVALLHGNRDAKVFAEPESLALAGQDGVHLTFGHGVHRCLGAPLARLQVRAVLERLLHRFPTLRFAAVDTPVIWKDGLATRGLARLLVDW